jgi:hypothetical protein
MPIAKAARRAVSGQSFFLWGSDTFVAEKSAGAYLQRRQQFRLKGAEAGFKHFDRRWT